jgi:two-component system, NtrC family, sensor histidine kinase KinB
MLRWKLTLGLLGTLIILLLVGSYSIWLFNGLGSAVDNVLRDNYDSIKVCHFMRVATARITGFYVRGDRPVPPYDDTGPLDDVEREFRAQMPILARNARGREQQQLVERLERSMEEFIAIYRALFERYRQNKNLTWDDVKDLRTQVAPLTLRITEISEKILKENEAAMLKANEIAIRHGKDSIRLLIIAMLSAVILFVFTYARLGQAIIRPIQKLTGSIRELRARDFDQQLAVTSDDEMGQLTREFNVMAHELRNFYRETGQKVIELNQVIRAMLTTLPYPLFILDNDDVVARMNPAAERLMESLGSTGELPVQIQKHLARASTTGSDYRFDDLKQALLFRVSDAEVYYLPRIFSIVLEDGRESGRALMLVDVTKFRWLDEMKSDLLSTLSHEIKTPLTGIRLVLHLLLEKRTGELSNSQEELLGSARDDCERLLKTLNSILDLARMESGKAQLSIQPVEPFVIAQDAYRAFHDQAEAANRPLRLDLPAKAPRVYVDLDRIGLVLSNFLSNALKYGTKGTPITIRVRQPGSEMVRFSVLNQGPELSPEDQVRVFDKFYRIARQGSEGAGLGLSIARQIVQAHDGKIGVQTTSESRTEFFFDLPAE